MYNLPHFPLMKDAVNERERRGGERLSANYGILESCLTRRKESRMSSYNIIRACIDDGLDYVLNPRQSQGCR